jgi:DNA (cytosine-5)-methyltransferase 1
MLNKNTYIDLFAGCGGLSLGLHQAGWQGLFAIEKSPLAFSTLKHNLIDKLNHFDWPDWLLKTEHDIDEILKTKKENLFSLRGKVDMVAGGPPCQGFSSAGKRDEADHRNQLIHSYISFIRLVQPKIIFFENVKGFTLKFEKNKDKGINYSELVKKSLSRSGKNFSGYEVYGELIDFSEYGIPQKRTRFILVGIRKDLAIELGHKPSNFFRLIQSNREKFLISNGLGLSHSVSDAISDLLMSNGTVDCPDSEGFKSALYGKTHGGLQTFLRKDKIANHIPDSHRLTNHSKTTIDLFNLLLNNAPKGKRIEGDERHEFNLKKRGLTVLDFKKPSPTLTSHPDDYIHYSEPRILTVREYARIQTFPDWYEFKAKYTTGGKVRKHEVPRYTQIGNAIPPLFSNQAGEVLKMFFND